MRLLLCALFLAAPLLAQEEEIVEEEAFEEPGIGEEEVILEEELGMFPAGRLSKEKRDHDAVFLRVGEAGHLQVKDGEAWRDANLDEVSTTLYGAKRLHHAFEQKKGGTGYEVVGGGVQASKLFVSIEATPDTPWQHLQWLTTIAAEQQHYKLELSDGKRRVLAFLPTDMGIQPALDQHPTEILARVHLVARGEEEAKWGEAKVKRPARVAYKLGDREADDLAAVGEWIATAKKAAAGTEGGVQVVGEIRAGHRVPFGKVFDVMETYLDKGVPAMNFYGTQVPTAELRELKRLPYPIAGYR